MCTGTLTSDEDSLFYYRGNMSWMDFHDQDFSPTFAPNFTDPDLEAEAMALCDGDPACLFDVAATSRLDIGLSTLTGQEEINIIQTLETPSEYCYSCLKCVCMCICM